MWQKKDKLDRCQHKQVVWHAFILKNYKQNFKMMTQTTLIMRGLHIMFPSVQNQLKTAVLKYW